MTDEQHPAGRQSDPPEEPKGDDPVARAILESIETLAPGRSIAPVEVARAVARARARPGDPPDAWRRYLPAVRQQALVRGEFVLTRRPEVRKGHRNAFPK